MTYLNLKKWILISDFGWLTVSVMFVSTHCEADSKTCQLMRLLKCNSYIKLFVNNKPMLKSSTKLFRQSYDPLITLTTEKIAKNSTIRIEVWDSSYGFWDSDALIQSTEGNIQSFLNEPLREGADCGNSNRNSIETMLLWQDEYLI